MTSPRVGFGAVIAHADEPEMLARCVAHHRRIGVERILVVLNGGDPESEAVARTFGGGTVRAVRVDPDPATFLTAALDAMVAWAAPEWLLFADSDEFWLTATGRVADLSMLAEADVLRVPRFNAPPVRAAGGSLTNVDVVDAARTLLVAARSPNAAASVDARSAAPWSAVEIAPKVIVRPDRVDRIAQAAHEAFGQAPLAVRWASDALIVHLPFTTEARFRRKVAAVRRRLAAYPDRFRGESAWHWRRWVALDDAGETAAEFARQTLPAADVPALLARGALATPQSLFGVLALR